MADNPVVDNGGLTDYTPATKEVSHSGDTAHVQLTELVYATGSEGSRTVVELSDANGAKVQGGVAHDAADAGAPVAVGGNARTTLPTAVADGDRVRGTFDKFGRQLVAPMPRELVTHATATLSNTSETTVLAAGGAGVLHDAVMLLITSNSTSYTRCDIRDATAGTVRFSVHLPPYGGAVIQPPVPIPQASANNNWTAQLSATPSGSGDVRVFMVAIKQA